LPTLHVPHIRPRGGCAPGAGSGGSRGAVGQLRSEPMHPHLLTRMPCPRPPRSPCPAGVGGVRVVGGRVWAAGLGPRGWGARARVCAAGETRDPGAPTTRVAWARPPGVGKLITLTHTSPLCGRPSHAGRSNVASRAPTRSDSTAESRCGISHASYPVVPALPNRRPPQTQRTPCGITRPSPLASRCAPSRPYPCGAASVQWLGVPAPNRSPPHTTRRTRPAGCGVSRLGGDRSSSSEVRGRNCESPASGACGALRSAPPRWVS
jgi:hypothetical protein